MTVWIHELNCSEILFKFQAKFAREQNQPAVAAAGKYSADTDDDDAKAEEVEMRNMVRSQNRKKKSGGFQSMGKVLLVLQSYFTCILPGELM